MKKLCLLFFAVLLGAVPVIGGMSSVYAQGGGSDEFTLEEITVTAQKRAENSQKVPIAMETMTGETIKELGRTDIDQILSTVSSVLINKASDGMRVTLRGMSNDQGVFHGRQVSTPTVAVNMDGAYTNRSAAGNNLFDIERVEVLYGPQSTLYSTSSPGGVVNVVTAEPKLDAFSASAILEAGDYNLRHGEATVNVPFGGKFAFRLAGNYSKRDGYLSNGADDEDIQSGRLKALYQATEDLSFTLIGEYTKQGGQGMGANGVELFDKESDVADPWTAAPGRGENEAGPQPINDGVNKKLSGRIDWDLGLASLAIVPSYTPRDVKSTSTGVNMQGDATYTLNAGEGYEKSIEARMVSSEEFAFKWILGASWYHSWDEMSNDTYITADNTFTSYMYGYQDIESKAVFGNATYPVTDRFRATAGLRYSSESTYSYNIEEPGRGQESVDMTYDSPDYKVGAEYDLAENSMLFTDFSTSYRTQGMGTRDDGSAFPPEKLKAFTLGSKNRFFNNRMQVNASAYYYIYENYMATTMIGNVTDNYDPDNPTVPIAREDVDELGNKQLDYVDNNGNGVFDWGVDTLLDGMAYPGGGGPGSDGTAGDSHGKVTGDAKVYGVDISTTTLITQALKLDLSASYLRKYFTDLTFALENITKQLWNMDDIVYDGKDMTFAPKWTVNAALTYDFILGNGGRISPTIDTRYQSSYKMYFLDEIIGTSFNRDTNEIEGYRVDVTKSATQEAHHISNFTLVYASPSDKWSLSAYVKNIENYAVKRSIFKNSPDNVSELTIGPPRTVGAILSIRY